MEAVNGVLVVKLDQGTLGDAKEVSGAVRVGSGSEIFEKLFGIGGGDFVGAEACELGMRVRVSRAWETDGEEGDREERRDSKTMSEDRKETREWKGVGKGMSMRRGEG
jgi:hypothetical protein